MASLVGQKIYSRWLWHAKLKQLLKPLAITKFYPDKLKTYPGHLTKDERQISKYKMQKIERETRRI